MRKKIIYRMTSMSLAILLCSVMLSPVAVSAGEATINLGSTENFAILAGTTITNTGTSKISGDAGGDIGVSPGSAIIGFPPGLISDGTAHSNDALTIAAKTDLVTAYNEAAGRPFTLDLTGQDLGGMTLTSGVYRFDSSAAITGTLTLDAQGDPDAAFIFQIGSTLKTASGSIVSLINGAQYCRVFWQVGSSATLGTSSKFIGHILAMTSITVTTTAEVQGQLLARDGAVTLDTNTITNGVCAAPTATPTPTSAAESSDSESPQTGETGTFGLSGLILVVLGGGLALYLRRSKVH